MRRKGRELHKLEHDACHELERLGLPKETLINIDGKTAERIYDAFLAGQLTLQRAITEIVEMCIEGGDPKVGVGTLQG